MIRIPGRVLNSLQCTICAGYLNVSPIMVSNNSQICGKCFDILPQEDKQNCLRQIGLEAVADILVFPCRYHDHGCTQEVCFNSTEDHEKECQYRFHVLNTNDSDNSFVDSNTLNTHNTDTFESQDFKTISVSKDTKDVKVNAAFKLKPSAKYLDNALLKYQINICGNDENALCLQSEQYIRKVQIVMEGALSVRGVPENIFCDVRTKGATETITSHNAYEPTYDTIDNRNDGGSCNNCRKPILMEVYHCPHGHDYCRNCKGMNCLYCITSVSHIPKYYCKNFARGCKEKLSATDVSKHETDCEFNSFRCPLPACDWHGTLSIMRLHVQENHSDKVTLNMMIRRASTSHDQNWFMFAHDNIFKCKYFYFGDYVEFLIIYLGSNDNAQKFKYEVEVLFHGKSLTRSAYSIGWNGFSIDKGILVKKSDLREMTFKNIDNFNFDFVLRITDVSQNLN